MAQEWKVEGKNILITGGAAGLGAAYAEAFLESGAENIAILDVDEITGKNYAEYLNKTYKNQVIFIKCDVSKEEEIKNGFQDLLYKFKRIDVLINNAGVMDDSRDAWRTASDVNWQGLVSFTRKGIEHMSKSDGGSGGTIINVSSAAAFLKMDFVPIYCASKAAVLHFGRCISIRHHIGSKSNSNVINKSFCTLSELTLNLYLTRGQVQHGFTNPKKYTPELFYNTDVRILTICLGGTYTAMIRNLEPRFIEHRFTNMYNTNMPVQKQSVDSAVKALMKMFNEGKPGTVWLSQFDQPGQDITRILDEAYRPLETLVLPEALLDAYLTSK